MRFFSFLLVFALVLTPLVAQKKPVTDDTITDQVKVKLANDAEIGGLNIDVDVKQGVATLSGRVRTDKQRSKAEKVAKKVKGVSSVNNRLEVRPD